MRQAPQHEEVPDAGGATGASGGDSGGASPQITVEVDPNPLVETGQSEIHAVIQVETLPSCAGDTVNIDSSQLAASCFGGDLRDPAERRWGHHGPAGAGRHHQPPHRYRPRRRRQRHGDRGRHRLRPGDVRCRGRPRGRPLPHRPTTLVARPPVVTPEGVTGYPQTAGVAQEVETGDTSTSGDSDIYAVFYVETNPVYAEQTVELDSTQLETRCIGGWSWDRGNAGAHEAARRRGNHRARQHCHRRRRQRHLHLRGRSCAAGPSQVIADVMAGTHPTYVTEFTVDPPAPTHRTPTRRGPPRSRPRPRRRGPARTQKARRPGRDQCRSRAGSGRSEDPGPATAGPRLPPVTAEGAGSDQVAVDEESLGGILTVPNLITFVRLACIPLFVWLLFGAHRQTGRGRPAGRPRGHRLGGRLRGPPLPPGLDPGQGARPGGRPAAGGHGGHLRHRPRGGARCGSAWPPWPARCSSRPPCSCWPPSGPSASTSCGWARPAPSA